MPRAADLRGRPALWALCLAGFATCAGAEVPKTDGIRTEGLLSDDDFYHLATCGAVPGGPCRGTALHWEKRTLTLRLDRSVAPGGDSVQYGIEDRFWTAIRHAVDQVNGLRAGIRLKIINDATADITIRPTTLRDGELIESIPGLGSGSVMGAGHATVWWSGPGRIKNASILISTRITGTELTSVMLEEVTQSLGFIFDIENPQYEGVSILAQESNSTTTLAGQDRMMILRHYPPD